MQWLETIPDAVPADDALEHYFLETLARHQIVERENTSLHHHAAARSAAVYCAPAASRGINQHCLIFHLVRALWGAGDPESAQALIEQVVDLPKRVQRTWLTLLDAGHMPPLLWSAALHQLVYVQPPGAMEPLGIPWSLRVERIAGWADAIELARWPALRTVVVAWADYWQCLDVRPSLTVVDRSPTAVATWQWVQEALQEVANERGWSDFPHLLKG